MGVTINGYILRIIVMTWLVKGGEKPEYKHTGLLQTYY